MSLETVDYVGQTVGVVAILAILFLVLRELHENTVSMRITATRRQSTRGRPAP